MRDEIKEQIRQFVCDYVDNYGKEHNCSWLWREPLTGFADANCEYIKNIEKAVETKHKKPSDYLENPTIVISCFVPFTKEVSRSNTGIEGNFTSEEWSNAYVVTNTMLGDLAQATAEEIQRLGYNGAVPTGISMKEGILKSPWSHRHIAFAAGLGTFGINNMLITRSGCCGRYCSVISDIPVTPDKILEGENCLYKKNGSCKKCVEHCFYGALTTEGFDRFKCFEACMRNEKLYGEEVCGKCVTEIPCAFIAPGGVK